MNTRKLFNQTFHATEALICRVETSKEQLKNAVYVGNKCVMVVENGTLIWIPDEWNFGKLCPLKAGTLCQERAGCEGCMIAKEWKA